MSIESSLAVQIGDFVADAPRVPPSDMSISTVVENAVLDTMSVSLAARTHPHHRHLESYASGLQSGTARGWSMQRSFHPHDAALINAVAAHILEFDDVSAPLRGHPSAILLPALLAAASETAVVGQYIVDAYAIGFEVMLALAERYGARIHKSGWHPTSVLGPVAAATAVCRLNSFDRATTAAAIGIAAAQTAGSRLQFGHSAKSFQVGCASAAGLRAANAARAGFEASPLSLDAVSGGLGDLYTSGSATEEDAVRLELEATPERMHIVRTGLLPKLFPVCFGADVPVRAALEAVSHHGGAFESSLLRSVRATVTPETMDPLVHENPRTLDEARFSLNFTVALALVRGQILLDDLHESTLNDPNVQHVMRLITVDVVGERGAARSAKVDVLSASGALASGSATTREPQLRQAAKDPILRNKIASCTSAGLRTLARDAGHSNAVIESMEGWRARPASSLAEAWWSGVA